MIQWYKKVVFENFANFKGRARRSEYWYFTLANIIISFIAMIIDEILHLKIGSSNSGVVNSLYGLIMFVPSLAVSVRRLHDIGKSGWLLLIAYAIMIIGVVALVATSMSAIMGGGDMPTFGASFIIGILMILGVAIWILILFCKEGDQGANKYGADPKANAEEINEIGTE